MMDLDNKIRQEIITFAKKNNIQKVMLFGSRARGDSHDRSDIDLAVTGGEVRNFRLNIEEEVRTLLMFDVVNLDDVVQDALREIIQKEGITIYEKA